MTRLLYLCAAGVFLAATSVAAQEAPAQEAPASGAWTRGSSINVFGGLATDGSRSGVDAGAAIGWDVTPRIGMEGTASWLDRGTRADAFAADLSVLFFLVAPRRTVPFVKAGGGVYRTWLDTVESPIPEFYGRRIVERPIGTSATFTDGMIVAGGGANVWVSSRIAIRPEVETKFVVADGRTYPVTTVGVRLAFYFEEHPTTDRQPRAAGPSRGR